MKRITEKKLREQFEEYFTSGWISVFLWGIAKDNTLLK